MAKNFPPIGCGLFAISAVSESARSAYLSTINYPNQADRCAVNVQMGDFVVRRGNIFRENLYICEYIIQTK